MKAADRAEIVAKFCAGCACEVDEPPPRGPVCPIRRIEDTERGERDRSGAWQHHALVPVCVLFRRKRLGPRLTAEDPYAGQWKARVYDALPRDPKTGRPVI